MTFPEFLQPILGTKASLAQILYGMAGAAALFFFALLWLRFGRWPRRRRAARRAEKALAEKNWQAAADDVALVQRLVGRSRGWNETARRLEGKYLLQAADKTLADNQYEEALKQLLRASECLGLDPAESRRRVVEAMTAHLHRLFVERKNNDLDELAARIGRVAPRSGAPPFWQALSRVRQAKADEALALLQKSAAVEQAVDPLLYQAALQLRRGKSQDALKLLSEAHRLDKENPLVNAHLGQAIVAGGGDRLAVRALTQAVGDNGLPRWLTRAERFWAEVLPGGPVSKLAALHPFLCPVFGSDLPLLIGQAKGALALAHYRLGHYQEAADLFEVVLQDSPPTLRLLRGLGKSLTRLGRHDEAFKHLKIAFEMEEPREPVTAAYLALCGARGRPNRPEDRRANVDWAVRLLSKYFAPAQREWAELTSQVHAEARGAGVPAPVEDQTRLCAALASFEFCDAAAAGAFEQLAAECPDAVRDDYAWLYCRARCAETNGEPARDEQPHPVALSLFTRTCRLDSGARAYFTQREWSFEDVEFSYLCRLAACAQRPTAFQLTPEHETLLQVRSRRHEEAKRLDEATRCIEVWHALAPSEGRALDRLAYLYHRQALLDRASECLLNWHRLEPGNAVPLARYAVIEQLRGCTDSCYRALHIALEQAGAHERAGIAYLGARLALAAYYLEVDRQPGNRHFNESCGFLERCLEFEPAHAAALAALSALRALAADRPALAALTPRFGAASERTPVLHYFDAVCRLAAGESAAADRAAEQAALTRRRPTRARHTIDFPENFPVGEECAFLIGQAALMQGDSESALRTLSTCAGAQGPSTDHARAMLGRLQFQLGGFKDASRWWRAVAPQQRRAWQLDVALRDTVVLTALQALEAGRFEQALDGFKEAVRLGWNDPRRDEFTNLARVKQARLLLFEDVGESFDVLLEEPDESGVSSVLSPRAANARSAAFLLEQAMQNGSPREGVARLLARARQELGDLPGAREALLRVPEPDAALHLQLGLLALRELATGAPGKLAQAEGDFLRAASTNTSETARNCQRAALVNLLLTRLALGKLPDADEAIGRLIDLGASSNGDEQRQLGALRILLRAGLERQPDASVLGALAHLDVADEANLLERIRRAGNLAVAQKLLATLALARPSSLPVRQALLECDLLNARNLVDRCQPLPAARMLTNVSSGLNLSAAYEAALFNLLGCCSCLTQDFEAGAQYFILALEQTPDDARIVQNLALAYELGKRQARADKAWDRFLDVLDDRVSGPPGFADYHRQLAFSCLMRLAQRYYDQETWVTALDYLRRAFELRPDDADVLERLFHVYNQLKHFADARAILERLRQLRADQPQFELYELELMEVRGPDDLDKYLTALADILQRHAGEAPVHDRARALLGHVLEYIANLGRQYREQLDKTTRSLERLPSYQINWPEVHRYLRELRTNFKKIGRLLDRCHTLPTITDVHQRRLQQLRGGVEESLRQCRSLGG